MKNIAIIAGGNSSEYEVSMKSGKNIYDEVDETRYNKYLVVLKERDWHVEIGEEKYPVDKNDFSFTRNGEKILFDFAYITIHGVPGENGLLQGYLDMMGVPYGCCNVLASALTFDKHTCNTYLKSYGVNVADSVMLIRGMAYDVNEIINEVGLPCFVKPNAEGSSFGVTKVKEAAQLEDALKKAFALCREVLIETFIDGTELTCGVVKAGDMDITMPIAEVVPKNEFFDFEAKYDPTKSDEIIPARISPELTNRIKTLSSMIYDILRCEGIIRVDYIVREDEIFMLEVNTTPGMTSNSFVPKMVRAMGGTLREVLTKIIDNKLN
ncbi:MULTISPECIES: D-alanine--D-alanine ligase [Butyricimonas]|jgi:D-ala D-ala ligase N-terminal domain protein|uniref:D-alanine--D-alanine ligase n=1 Tax=Butyricimonas faecihominis TaxID=1472416 RepID=A0A7W6HUI3_9BACT|nr:MULTISPECIES: D-alanine--D-alanine ligase [Butyricimonas]MBS6687102.1 D-alanine--D-alanine ligase [Sanguibacteroides justesenii]OKZ15306.1 MAG: D-alanine--D-alanine ligase A [Butyricimonas synergistica]KAB1508760.1 D-alanine--D-alanine ligase [Butyricimonas faecihominis]MBB4025213.1 D-alanine-D-alanine ligase [Butyricimonas faecihominis]WOF07064.1 D-alanine--D-alanine ligase [Butyricimonas faecihominis]